MAFQKKIFTYKSKIYHFKILEREFSFSVEEKEVERKVLNFNFEVVPKKTNKKQNIFIFSLNPRNANNAKIYQRVENATDL